MSKHDRKDAARREDAAHHGSDEAKAGVNRRGFLTWATRGSLAVAAAAVAGQFARFLSFEPPLADPPILAVGQPDSFQRRATAYIAEARLYIRRDNQGLSAVDAVCTHLGCLVKMGEGDDAGGFVCPCHDSKFDAQGIALNGPATKPLRFLHLWIDEETGQVMVDRSLEVDASTRLPV
jgi:cytochrome b6-f complex iron-sulfur subunit